MRLVWLPTTAEVVGLSTGNFLWYVAGRSLAPNAEQLASQQQTTTREERSQWSIAEQNESKSKLSTILSQFTGENQLQTGCNIAISEKMKPLPSQAQQICTYVKVHMNKCMRK